MKDILINDFEQKVINFSEFVVLLFKHHSDLKSFSISLRTHHVILKGKKVLKNYYLEVCSLKLVENNKEVVYYENCFNNIQKTISFFSFLHLLYPSKDKSPLHSIFLLNEIKKQPLFYSANHLKELYGEQLKWQFNREQIETDIKNFLGYELNKKLYTLSLLSKLDNNKHNFTEFRYKV